MWKNGLDGFLKNGLLLCLRVVVYDWMKYHEPRDPRNLWSIHCYPSWFMAGVVYDRCSLKTYGPKFCVIWTIFSLALGCFWIQMNQNMEEMKRKKHAHDCTREIEDYLFCWIFDSLNVVRLYIACFNRYSPQWNMEYGTSGTELFWPIPISYLNLFKLLLESDLLNFVGHFHLQRKRWVLDQFLCILILIAHPINSLRKSYHSYTCFNSTHCTYCNKKNSNAMVGFRFI